jgi:flavin reductase (DIM6/NTAB) family NADH-FMN oxidoreductase RutF
MIPYGLYVLTSEAPDGRVATATVNWVTQASFEPPLVAVGVRVDSGAHAVIDASRSFALNVLGKGQQALAQAFFRDVQREGDRIGGHRIRKGTTGAPLLEEAAAWIECRVVERVTRGDHSLVLGEVVDAAVAAPIPGRPDDATLVLRDLGEKTFYGG